MQLNIHRKDLHRICAMKENGKAKIQVEDNGPGICDEMKPHIFEMFYTGKNTIADSHRSLGLGLALCRSIIEVHNGETGVGGQYTTWLYFFFYTAIK